MEGKRRNQAGEATAGRKAVVLVFLQCPDEQLSDP